MGLLSGSGKRLGLKYRLIAIDLDGTIINKEGEIFPNAKKVIQRAIEMGVKVTIATGRMYRPSSRFARELGLTAPIICYQGALIREPYGGNVLWHKPLSVDTAREVIDKIRQIGVQQYVYIDDEIFVEEITEKALWYAQRNDVKLNLVGDLVTSLEKQPTEIAARGEPEEIDRLTDHLKVLFGRCLLVTKSYPTFCEIGHPSSGKGIALKRLAKLLGVERSQTVAIGDGPNDLSMLKWAGLGIVTGTAPQEVIAAADWVIETETGDGLTRAIETLLNM